MVGRQRGSVTLWWLFMMPILVIMMLLVIEVGKITDTKIYLQTITDRAVFAAAARMSYWMNLISVKNFHIRQIVGDLKSEFESNMQESRSAGQKRIQNAQKKIEALKKEMNLISENAMASACQTAVDVLHRNTQMARLFPLYGRDGAMLKTAESCTDFYPMLYFEDAGGTQPDQEIAVRFDYMSGGSSFFDPEKIRHDTIMMQQYRSKWSDYPSAFAARVKMAAPISLWPALFHQSAILETSAAAQPFGGSIKRFAFNGKASLADSILDTEIEKWLYKPAFISMKAISIYKKMINEARYD